MKFYLLTALWLCVSRSLFACSCDFPKSPQEALDRASVVFSGKVLSVTPDGWIFQVDRGWKGKLSEKMTVINKSKGTKCDPWFSEGKMYLVFASSLENGSGITSNVCSGNITLKDFKGYPKQISAGKLISEYLKEGTAQPAAAPGATRR